MDEKIIFYTYNDKYGQGINPQHLITYSSSIIFDKENRTLYANGSIVGNHFFNSYHGEVFNDYHNNAALGNYSSALGADNIAAGNYSTAAGHGNISQAPGSFSTGTYNSASSDSLFTIGNGSGYEDRSNALEVKTNGDVYLSGQLISDGTDIISYIYDSYNYIKEITAYTASDAQIKELSSKVSANEESITYLVQIDDQLASDIDDLKTSYSNLEKYTSDIEVRLSELETAYTNLQASYDTLSSYTYSEIAKLSNSMLSLETNGEKLVVIKG